LITWPVAKNGSEDGSEGMSRVVSHGRGWPCNGECL